MEDNVSFLGTFLKHCFHARGLSAGECNFSCLEEVCIFKSSADNFLLYEASANSSDATGAPGCIWRCDPKRVSAAEE